MGCGVVLFSDFGPYGAWTMKPCGACEVRTRPSSERARPGHHLFGRGKAVAGHERFDLHETVSHRARNRRGPCHRGEPFESHPRNLEKAREILLRINALRAVVVSSPIHLPRVKGLTAQTDTAPLFDVTAYDFQQSDPPIAWHTVYQQVHHEFAALLASTFFPVDFYGALINLIRD